jgi:hypothetical protein
MMLKSMTYHIQNFIKKFDENMNNKPCGNDKPRGLNLLLMT